MLVPSKGVPDANDLHRCVALFSLFHASELSASISLDIGANLPAALVGTTMLADGTSIALRELKENAILSSAYPNASSSDFKFSQQTPAGDSWAYYRVDVMFGTDFGVSNDGNVSAADFRLTQSSFNGTAQWYEFGFLDVNRTDGSADISDAAIQAYLSNRSNYDQQSDTGVGTTLGAVAANDEINNRDAIGNVVSGAGSQNGNTTWTNSEFGLTADASIRGFSFFHGASALNGDRSGLGGSIGTFTDSQMIQAIPEQASASLFSLTLIRLGWRRRRI